MAALSNARAAGTDLVIVRLGAVRVALRQAKTIQDKKKLVDVSVALKIFTKRQGASEEVKAEAASFHVGTMLLLGQALAAMENNRGITLNGRDAFGGSKIEPPKIETPTLAQLGIEKKTSIVAQNRDGRPLGGIAKARRTPPSASRTARCGSCSRWITRSTWRLSLVGTGVHSDVQSVEFLYTTVGIFYIVDIMRGRPSKKYIQFIYLYI
ncbi:MAG TPA: hypothetical protein VK642_03455 [Burkholderiales bacterium]|nr:hypothetical protein [Burkholderiales bacterium]